MALANRGVSGWFLTVTLVDQQADETTVSYELRATDAASATSSRDAILAELALRSKSVIKTASMSYIQDETALVIPTNGADNSIKARIVWLLAGGGKATQDIPAPADDTWVASSGVNNNIVDGSIFGTWAGFFDAGLVGAYISDGESMTATPFVKGQRVSSRRGLRRS